MPSLKHKFTSAKADAADATLVRPSNWNSDHDFTSDGASIYLGRDASGSGPIQEFAVDAGGTGDFTMWSKAAIQAAIAAALTTLHPFATGDVIGTIAATKTSGWVLCNGQGLFLGNGESNHQLFLLLWAINGGTWPVSPSRGASAEADWLASKVINVPDMRGCTLGMVDSSTLVNTLLTPLSFGLKVGAEKVSLTIPNIPEHDHTLYDPANMLVRGNLGGSGGGTPANFDGTSDNHTGKVGGDPAAVPPNSVPVPVNVTQPTIGVNFFIKL